MDEITKHLRNLTGINHDGVDCGGMVSTPDGDTMCQLPGGHDGDCGTASRFATGGLITSAEGSDSIRALLSPGEGRVTSEAIARYGAEFFEALNQRRPTDG